MYRLQRDKNINMLFYAAVTIGLILSLFHLIYFLFDMALSIVFYQKANISSIAYVICHLLIIYIPLLLLVPNIRTPKAIILKWVLYGISACYLLGNTWIIYYMVSHSVTALFTDSFETIYNYQRNSALMFNYMTWNSYLPVNVIYNIIQALLFYILGKTLYHNRTIFAFCIILSTVLSITIPLLYFFLSIEQVSDSSWLVKNIYILGTQVMTATALTAIATSPRMWEKFLWTYAERRY